MNIYTILEDELKRRNLQYADVKISQLNKTQNEKARKLLFPLLGHYEVSTDRKMRINVLQSLFSDEKIMTANDLTLNQIYVLRDAVGTYLENEILYEVRRLQQRLQTSTGRPN